MRPKIEFYRIIAPEVYFSPSAALAAGYKTLPFFEVGPEQVLAIAEDAFGHEISELREADLSVCDVLPTWRGSGSDISELKEISAQSLLSELDAGGYLNAIFEKDGLFIAIFGSDETWLVHARADSAAIFEQFSYLLGHSKRNAELLGKTAIFAPYFAGAA